MDIDFSQLKIWIISDGKPGHVNQSLGLAEALGAKAKVIQVRKRKCGELLNFLIPGLGFTGLPENEFPDILIGAGSTPSMVTQWFKVKHPKTFVVQLMRPRKPYDIYDVLAVPHYDKMPDLPNVVRTLGAPNRITSGRLQGEKKKWEKTFSKLKKKKLAVLIGGTSKRFTFGEKDAEILGGKLKDLSKDYSLMVTTSRRTGEVQTGILKEALKSTDHYFWDGEGDNPYLGMLAHADALVVTCDSASMVSEACSTGKPVMVAGLNKGLKNRKMGKFRKFFKTLIIQERVVDLEDGIGSVPEHPLSDAQYVAGFVRSRLLQAVQKK